MDGGVWPSAYDADYAAARTDPHAYWAQAAAALEWVRAPDASFTMTAEGHATWFPGGMLNACANALDRHVRAGRGAQTALIWESPAAGASASFTYAALLDRVARVAGGLRAIGVGVGDRVLICMPPIPECSIAMLACARLGAVHVVAFAGFAPAELARRIEDVAPKLVITASCLWRAGKPAPLLEGVRAATNRPLVVAQRPGLATALREGETDFEALAEAAPVPPVPMPAGAPLYILHTSGTTGRAKGVVRDIGGHCVALAHTMKLVYSVGAGEVFFTTADPGWVVGHSYGLYAPLLIGATIVLAEGATGAKTWEICARQKVVVLFTAPSLLRAMRQANDGVPAMPALRGIFLAGERADASSSAWAERTTGVRVLDHWWQTETGSAIAGSFAGLGEFAPPGCVGRSAPGVELCVLDEQGHELPPGEAGELALRLPLPPGCLTGLWQGEAPYFSYPGYYRSFDYGSVTLDGYVTILSRTDDVLNIAGRRLGAGEIEDIIASHPQVADCAVVRTPHRLRGEAPVAYVVPRPGVKPSLKPEIVAQVRKALGAFVGLRTVVLVESLPRTKSGKIIRTALAAGFSRP